MAAICNSIPLPQDPAPEQVPVQTHPSLCTKITGIALMVLAMIPVMVLCAVAFIASLVGDCACSRGAGRAGRQVYAIAIVHSAIMRLRRYSLFYQEFGH